MNSDYGIKSFNHMSPGQKRQRIATLYHNDLNLGPEAQSSIGKDCQPITEELYNKTMFQTSTTKDEAAPATAMSHEKTPAATATPAPLPTACPSCCSCYADLLRKRDAENDKRYRQLERKMNKLLSMMHDLHERQVVRVVNPSIRNSMIISPATTPGELQKLAENPHLVESLKMCIGKSPRDTIRKILKMCMTRELAIKYSYTGLGVKRRKEKLPFSNHRLCLCILENADSLQLNYSQKELLNDIKVCLRASRDWHGGRGSRCAPATPLQQQMHTAPAMFCQQQLVEPEAADLQE